MFSYRTWFEAVVALLLVALASGTAKAATQKIAPKGMEGSAGAGYVTFQILEPDTSRFRFDQGQFAALAAERAIGFMNLYLNLSLAYMTAYGQVDYDYSTLSGERYTAGDVNFQSELFQAGLGLKFKLIDGYWFRPYVEGGGTGGYFTMKYSNLDKKVTSTPAGGTNYKKEDSLLDFGKYIEGGLELQLSDVFGIRPAARFVESRTKKFKTLADRELQYKADIYYLALLAKF